MRRASFHEMSRLFMLFINAKRKKKKTKKKKNRKEKITRQINKYNNTTN